MNARLNLLREAAKKIAGQYKNRNISEFIPRRTQDRIDFVMSIEKSDTQNIEQEIKKIEQFLEVSERQIYFQNLHYKEASVLDKH
jgi:hypothetical protein